LNFDHPAFAPYQALIQALALADARPTLKALNQQAEQHGVKQAHGLPIRFASPQNRLSAREYECSVLQTGEVPTRPDTWHDVMNALVWLRFPRFKSALNQAHGQAIALETDSRRGRCRDAMTMLDESGVWVISRETALPQLLFARAWQSLFWDQRSNVEATLHFVVVGHALLEKALTPYLSMTGKCLMVMSQSLDPDRAEPVAIHALQQIESPRQLAPLPVQGIPGWDAANAQAEYYANTRIFRPLNPDGS